MSIRTFICQRIMGSYMYIILGVSLRAPIGGSSDSSAYSMQYDTHSEFTPVADSASINARGDLRVVLMGLWKNNASVARRVLSSWSKRCKLAHAFLWEYSYKRLKLAQLLSQLGVFLTAYLAVDRRLDAAEACSEVEQQDTIAMVTRRCAAAEMVCNTQSEKGVRLPQKMQVGP
jgi:hypothetical protein